MSSRSPGPFHTFSKLFVVCWIACVLPLPALAQKTAEDYATQGISLAKQGKFAEAEQELQIAVHAAPAIARYRAQLGSVLGLEGKWKEALASFQKAVDLAPQDLNFRRETAAVQWQLGLMIPAEKNLQFVLAKNPDDAGSILLLGMVKEKTGEFESAAQLLDSQFQLVIQHPDRTIALFHSSVQSGQREKSARVVEVLKQRTNDPQWANAISQCMQIAAAGGDLQTAAELLALFPANDAAHQEAQLQFAKKLYIHGQIAQAKDLLSQLTAQGMINGDLQILLGNCLEAEREPEQALQSYQRAIQTDPSRIEYYEDPISLLLYLRRASDAVPLVNHAIAIAPNDPRPWVWKGNVELGHNSYKDAMASYRQAAKLDRSNADAAFGIAAVYFVSGQHDAAITQYEAGISRFPNDARFYVGCAEMLLASPDSLAHHAQVKALLQKAVKLSPQSAQAHYLLGQLAMQQNRLQDAANELELALRFDPDRSKTHFALSTVYRRLGRADDSTKEFAIFQKLKQIEDGGTAMPMTAGEKP